MRLRTRRRRVIRGVLCWGGERIGQVLAIWWLLAQMRDLPEISKSKVLETFFTQLMAAVSRRSLEKNEEFILNAISCTTNILFYDTAQINLVSEEARIQIF